MGGNATLYKLSDASKILGVRANLQRISAESKTYIDEKGRELGGISYFGMRDFQFLEGKLDGFVGRPTSGRDTTLFQVDEGRRILAERDATPQVNETGIYSDSNDLRWGSGEYFGRVDYGYLIKNKDRCRRLAGRASVNGNGNKALLFNIEDAEKVLNERKGKKAIGYWTDPLVIESEARNAINNGIDLSQKVLRVNKKSSLAKAIYQNYPGGFKSLREKLGLNEPQIYPDQADEMMRGLEVLP